MYIVEGNIGAGKTTFLKLIQNFLPHVSVCFEPLQSWHNKEHGQSILSHFYTDAQRWAYSMETIALSCRVKEHLQEQENPHPFRLMERSIYSGHYVFATNDYHAGFLNDLEWKLYLEWFNFLVTGHCKTPQGFIYLHVDAEVAHERIVKRSRSSEELISLDYLKQIQQCHENFLLHKKDVMPELKRAPVLFLDCNKDFESDPEQLKQLAKQVAAFIDAGDLPGQTSFTAPFVLQHR